LATMAASALDRMASNAFSRAQASAMGVPILTRDAARYRAYFPGVEVVGPG
jgi:hypothetical protein